jgi:protein-S-isoprenylcysteine O-methyltransferase Ste14
MTVMRALLSRGVISPGWYAILTGLAMLYVVWLIAPVAHTDRAIPVVAVVLAITGIWSIERGLRSQLRRHPRADEASGP